MPLPFQFDQDVCIDVLEFKGGDSYFLRQLADGCGVGKRCDYLLVRHLPGRG